MKAILEFDLTDQADVEAHLRCVQSLDLVLFLLKIEEELRARLKHGELSECEWATLDKFREFFYLELNGRGLNIDSLVS
jgi:hypothetical protein